MARSRVASASLPLPLPFLPVPAADPRQLALFDEAGGALVAPSPAPAAVLLRGKVSALLGVR